MRLKIPSKIDDHFDGQSSRKRPRALLVLGMHRSGTSAVARMLSLLGAQLPARVVGVADSNPRGHWEPEALVAIHDEILGAGSSSWDDLARFQLEDIEPSIRVTYKRRLVQVLEEEYGDANLFVVKDPRICKLMPLWLEVLEEFDADPGIVIPLRNPLEVARSLASRDRMNVLYGQLLWGRYALDAERNTRDIPRILFTYEDFLRDWRAVRARMEKSFSCTLSSDRKDFANVDDFLSSDLRHHASSLEELRRDGSPLICQTYERFLYLVENDLAEKHIEQLEHLFVGLEDNTSELFRAVRFELEARRQHVDEQKRAVPSFHKQIEAWKDAAAHQRGRADTLQEQATAVFTEFTTVSQRLNNDIWSLREDVGRLNSDIGRLNSEIDSRNLRIFELQSKLNLEVAAAAAIRSQLDVIHASTSWRITVLLRKLGQNFPQVRLIIRRVLKLVYWTATFQLWRRFRAHRNRVTEEGAADDSPVIAALRSKLVGPLAHIRRVEGLRFANGQIVATHGDPQIHLTFAKAVSGWFLVETTVRASVIAHPPRIFFSEDDNYSEDRAIDLELIGPDHYGVVVRLRSLDRLRLDPADGAGPMTIDAISITRLSLRSRYQLLARKALVGLPPNHGSLAFYCAVARRVWTERNHIVSLLGAGSPRVTSAYERWIWSFDFDEGRDRQPYLDRVNDLSSKQLISILLPTYDTPDDILRATLDSVVNQIYPNWELCIADDRSTRSNVRTTLEQYGQRDKRIKLCFRETNGHIVEATNSAFSLALGDWIVLLDHDDLLRPHALAEIAFAIGRRPDATLIYSDEDKIDERGCRSDPFFKPDFSPDLLRSQNYFNHLTAYKAEIVRGLEGWRKGYEGAQDHDLNFRLTEIVDPATVIHIPKILYHWRKTQGSTALESSEKGYAFQAGLRAVTDHVRRLGWNAHVQPAEGVNYYRVNRLIAALPLVSLIIPTRDRVETLRACLNSILTRTDYPRFEVIVIDNGSVETETFRYFGELKSDRRVSILSYPGEFNYSAINNFAVDHANGQIIGFLNNDVEIISPGWLTEMVSHATRPEVGCVGAMLYYPNDTIQHAGVILGIGGVAGHSHKYFARGNAGYFSRLRLCQNISAVTAACLVVRKEIFLEVGKLDAEDLKIAFNDVDFCIKVMRAGYFNVWTPYAELYHHESTSRGTEDSPEKQARFQREVEVMKERWNAELAHDRYYSPNLTLLHENFAYKKAEEAVANSGSYPS